MHSSLFVSAQTAYRAYGFYCKFGIYPHQLGWLGGLGFSGGRWLGAEVDNNNRQSIAWPPLSELWWWSKIILDMSMA